MTMKPFTLKLEPGLIAEIERWCEKTGDNKSEFIRKAIQFYINHLREQEEKRRSLWRKLIKL